MKIRKKKRLLKTFTITIIIMLAGVVVYNLYKMYENIDITDNYTAERTGLSTQYEQTVENAEKKSQVIADVIENVTKSVCGVSKLSNAGGAVLSTATESELGLGTGIIVSSNGYILSNSHVTGDKYSTCYVKIEDGDTYTGTVVWADTSLDLSIIKIRAEISRQLI